MPVHLRSCAAYLHLLLTTHDLRRFLERAAACDESWGDGKQSDAQEFLRCLLDALHSVHKRPSSPLPKRALPSRSVELQVGRLCHLILRF